MSIYVDNYRGKFRNMIMCHMMSDTSIEELHEFANKLGLKKSYYQSKSAAHYDICLSKRIEAIKLGAIDLPIRSPLWRIVYHKARKLLLNSTIPDDPEKTE